MTRRALSRIRWIIGAALLLAATGANIARAAEPPTPYQQARQVREAIIRGDFATARQITQSVLTSSRLQRWHFYPFANFVASISELHNPAFGTRLAAWVKRDPSDAIPLLISANYNFARAWSVRGEGSVAKTERARLVTFEDYSAQALDDVERSTEHNNKDPYAYYLKLEILHGFGLHKDLIPQFETAIAHFPAYYSLYKIVLSTLEPRWGGSFDAMYAFVDQYAGHAPKDSPLKLLYVQLYLSLLNQASLACASSNQPPRCVDLALQRLVRPGLEENLKAAFALYATGDRSEFDFTVLRPLYAMASMPHGEIPVAKIIKTAAGIMDGDTSLKPSNPGHNNYVIDMVMAQFWLQEGAKDSALKKAELALLDADNTHFSSAVDKRLIVASIHELIALLYSDLGRRQDMIEAEKAAMALNVPLSHPQFVCLGYYGLKDYPRAIEACSQVLADDPDNLEARFWRGQAYDFAKSPHEGEADLTVVAQSGSPRRFDAAMGIVMMHIEDRDYRAAVAVTDKFPFLLDPQLSDEQRVAMVYYNRCFAELQLKDLHRALDDCDQSIKLGDTSGAEYMLEKIKQQMTAP